MTRSRTSTRPKSAVAAAIALGIAAALAAGACGDDRASGESNVRGPDEPIAYPDGETGLDLLISDLVEALEQDERERARRLVASMQLPEPEAWFKDVFGDELGSKLVEEYQPTLGQFDQLVDVLAEAVAAGQTQILIEQFQRPDDPAATGYQSEALAAMKSPTTLYSVRLVGEERAFHLWSLIHERGTFRWIGKLTAAADKPSRRRKIDKRLYRRRDADEVAKKLKEAAVRSDKDDDS